MKLIIAIVNSDDSSAVQGALTENGYFVTKLSTTGGFLKKGNTTFFVGTNDDKVEIIINDDDLFDEFNKSGFNIENHNNIMLL